MTTSDALLATASGGAAALALALAASFFPRARLATRRAVLAAGVLVAAVVPLAALAASAAGLGLRPARLPLPDAEATATADPAPAAAHRTEASRPPPAPAPPASFPPADRGACTVAAPEGRSWPTVAALLWATGAALSLASVLAGLVQAARLRRTFTPCRDPRAEGVFESRLVLVPATVGILRPVVVLPSGLAPRLDDSDLAAVLRHERAHAARRDPFWGLLGRVARATHWPNPLAHVVARRLEATAESLADAAAVEGAPAAAARYAACLLRLAEGAIGCRPRAGAQAIVGRRGTLAARVDALLDPRRRPDARRTRWTPLPAAAVALVGLAAVGLALPRPAAAVAGDGPEDGAAPRREGLTYVGRVLDPDGKPVEGAIVWADSGSSFQVMLEDGLVPWRRLAPDALAGADTWNAVRAAAPTGLDGRFAVEGVGPAAGGSVRAVHPKWASAVVAVAGTAATKDGRVEVGDVVLRRGESLTAKILGPDGKPAAGAWFAAQPEAREIAADRLWPWSLGRAPGHARVARADDAGIATLQGLEPATRYAIAVFSDRAPPREARVTTGEDVRTRMAATCGWEGAALEGDRWALVVRLEEGRSLRVIALDRASGAPRPGCRVDLSLPEEGGLVSFPRPGPVARAATGADGTAEFLGLDAREYEVTVVPADQASVEHHEPPPFSVRARAKAGGDPVKVALDPVRSVRVEPFDRASGAGVPDVRLLFSPVWQGYDQAGGFPADVSLPRRGLDAIATRDGTETALVTGLRPGHWTLRAYAAGYRPATADAFEVAAEGQPPLLRVPLDRAVASASGRVVVRRTGMPLAGARVRAYEWVDWLYDGPKAEATTGPDGRFRFDGLVGKGVPLHLDVSAPGYLPAEVTREDREQEGGADVALVAAATVTGVYRDAGTGAPLPHASVELWRGDGRSGLKSDLGARATTDAAGRFRVEGIAPGLWTLVPRGGEKSTITLEEGASLEVTLTAGR